VTGSRAGDQLVWFDGDEQGRFDGRDSRPGGDIAVSEHGADETDLADMARAVRIEIQLMHERHGLGAKDHRRETDRDGLQSESFAKPFVHQSRIPIGARADPKTIAQKPQGDRLKSKTGWPDAALRRRRRGYSAARVLEHEHPGAGIGDRHVVMLVDQGDLGLERPAHDQPVDDLDALGAGLLDDSGCRLRGEPLGSLITLSMHLRS